MKPYNSDFFWNLIETAIDSETPSEKLERDLRVLGFKELVRFELCLRQTIAKACTQRVAAAAYIMLGFLSDDALEDFIAWLILGGRQRYDAAILQPDSIAEYTSPAEGEGPVAEWLHMLPTEISESDGREEELEELVEAEDVQFEELPSLPSDPSVFKSMLPELYEKYWNRPWRPRDI